MGFVLPASRPRGNGRDLDNDQGNWAALSRLDHPLRTTCSSTALKVLIERVSIDVVSGPPWWLK
jgi:hypothetical protein